MEAKLKFANGTEIIAQANDNNYIVATKPQFPDNLKNIQITTEESTLVIKNGRIVECASLDGNYWFTVIEVPENIVHIQEMLQRLNDVEDALCEISK